jgi:hypothetical protein
MSLCVCCYSTLCSLVYSHAAAIMPRPKVVEISEHIGEFVRGACHVSDRDFLGHSLEVLSFFLDSVYMVSKTGNFEFDTGSSDVRGDCELQNIV